MNDSAEQTVGQGDYLHVEHEYYGTTARHYDAAYAADTRLKDIPFYVDLDKSLNGDTLEVACGTGRILLPTARSGVRIDGLDFSPDLLGILRNKLKSESQELQGRVSLHQGDMRNFALGKTYDLITVRSDHYNISLPLMINLLHLSALLLILNWVGH